MAINDVSLTSGMRSNLLSLQNTVNLLDRTQERLSTGKKVNSAIDNPVSYFAAQSLNSRASLIDSLKDSMGQAVQTVTAADKGITAISAMIEQAKGIAQSALSAAAGTTETEDATGAHAFVAGDVDIDISGMESFAYANVELTLGAVAADETFGIGGVTFTFTDAVGDGNFETLDELADAINTALSDQGIVATTVGDGGTTSIVISLTSGDFDSTDIEDNTSGLALEDHAQVAGDTLTFEGATYTAGVDFSTANELVAILSTAGFAASSAAGNVVTAATAGTTVTVGEFTASAGIDVAEGQEEQAASAFTVGGTTLTAGVDFEIGADDEATAANLAAAITEAGLGTATVAGAVVTVSRPSDEMNSLVEQYNTIRTQLTELAEDSGYKGKNLLSDDDLVVKFEGASLTVSGFDASAAGLGITAAAWASEADINASIAELDAAATTLSSESSKLSGNLSIITVRQDFSTNMVNTLTEGADKLTLADTNEEGANMLMLQTRQSLSTTALSLSAQAAQSVLQLFR